MFLRNIPCQNAYKDKQALMKKIISIAIVFIVVIGTALFLTKKAPFLSENKLPAGSGNFGLPQNNQPAAIENNPPEVSDYQNKNSTDDDFQSPVTRAGERITKKKFGIYVTPQNSPVSPEKFHGYHTGADFEIFPEELEAEVPIHAVCPGKLKAKNYVSGYGGLAVEECELDGEKITVLYGHLKLSSVKLSAGESVVAGEAIGILGADKSEETGGERKHLHLGFHRGSALDMRGYVQSQRELLQWVDPCLYVCGD